MYKKILKFFVFSLLLFGINNTFAISTSVGVKCPTGGKTLLINGNNIDNLANTNSFWVCLYSGWGYNNMNIMDYTGQSVYSMTFNHGGGHSGGGNFPTGNIIYMGKYAFLTIDSVLSGYINQSNQTYGGIDVFMINLQTKIITKIDGLTSSTYYAPSQVTSYYTFDDINLYISSNAPSGRGNIIQINKINGTITLLPQNSISFNQSLNWSSNKFYSSWLYSDALYQINPLNGDILRGQYDKVSNTIINTFISTNSSGSLVNSFNRLDLYNYLFSNNINTTLNNFNTGLIKTFSGFTSYISGTGNNLVLHSIPKSISNLADYNYSSLYAIIAGTGSNERFWYMSNGELFFNGNLSNLNLGQFSLNITNISSNTGSTSVVGSLNNPSGFLSFSNTGGIYTSSGCNVSLSSSWGLSIGGGSFLGFDIPSVSPFESFGCLISTVSYFITPPTSGNILGIDKNNATYTPIIVTPSYSGFGNYKFGDILLFMALVSVLFGLFNYGVSSIEKIEDIKTDKSRRKLDKLVITSKTANIRKNIGSNIEKAGKRSEKFIQDIS